MHEATELLHQLTNESRNRFQERQSILTFGHYLQRLMAKPTVMIRDSAQYVKDVFDHFGSRPVAHAGGDLKRWKLFDTGTERQVAIIGSEDVQEEIYKGLVSFCRQGYSNKLLLLHGPNGSAKTSIIESMAHAMHRYSELDEGAVYKFNWVFPTDRSSNPVMAGDSGPIGFLGRKDPAMTGSSEISYAYLDEARIASKIHSEFKENPVFLIPMPQREIWLRQWIGKELGIPPEDVELPRHVLLGGLSKRNQLILENLLSAYDGDLAKVLRHIQVERFFYSRQYRVGIATVEPQMSIDAIERQLTMDKNIANLPPVLHNISFHEAQGPLVEANRGLIEFSDMLKRPLEAYKYLLSTVEKGTLNLPSSTANLDIVFVATTNEKHLDGFKTLPDFASFKSRFELITVPYLLRPSQEREIYQRDIDVLSKTKATAPHTLDCLCAWAVQTRLRQPDPENFEAKYRGLLSRLDPRAKIALYEGEPLGSDFSSHEESTLLEIRSKLIEEYHDVVVYEGRFGASPREVRGILYRAVQNPLYKTLTPMAIFDELERLVKDRTVYEFLQLEPRGKYHQPSDFIKVIKSDFAQTFEREITLSMLLVDERQYENMLRRYVDHVVALVKREKIHNKITGTYEQANESLMTEVETIIGVSSQVERHREGLLGRVAAYRLDHPKEDVDVIKIFAEYLKRLHDHYYRERQDLVADNLKAILTLGTSDERNLKADDIKLARSTLAQLQSRFGYDEESARDCLKFLMTHQAHSRKS